LYHAPRREPHAAIVLCGSLWVRQATGISAAADSRSSSFLQKFSVQNLTLQESGGCSERWRSAWRKGAQIPV